MSANDVNAAVGESRQPNPEAIAWCVEEAQRLLEDQQRRAESLRTRGGQVAGFGAAVLALIGGNANDLAPAWRLTVVFCPTSFCLQELLWFGYEDTQSAVVN